MNGIAVLVTLAAVGVDYGWQPTSDGQLEYVIQIEPTLLESMKRGDEIASEILPEARGIRRFRIRVGTGPVPRVGHLSDGTTPRSLNTGNSGLSTNDRTGVGDGSVLPPRASSGGPPWGGEVLPSVAPAVSGGDFRPDGFLNLPPPPSLLSPDGKTSVLVRPGSSTMGSPASDSPDREILPPADSSNTWNGGGNGHLPVAPPGASFPPLNPAGSTSLPARTTLSDGVAAGVFPPGAGGIVESPDDPGSVSRPTPEREVLPPGSAPPTRPVRDSGFDADGPQPIRGYGRSGIQPPASSGTATLGPFGRGAARTAENFADAPGRDVDLLAQAAGDITAASQKPTIDSETAEKLESRPWTPLVLTSLALFASLAANFYLGWVAAGIYRRYRDVVAQLHRAQASLA